MILPEIHSITISGRNLSCAVWKSAKPSKPPVFCVHGLTRNGRDFDVIASTLCHDRDVYAPDMAGRGYSDWLDDKQSYQYETYIADILYLFDHFGLKQMDWIGTSMGGILGNLLGASVPQFFRKIVINDIGITISVEMMQGLKDYVGHHMHHPNKEAAMQYLRKCYAGFGLTEEWQWAHFFNHSFKTNVNGGYDLLYDPQILAPLSDKAGELTMKEDFSLSPYWEAISCPVLLIRGEFSSYLPREMAQIMVKNKPNARLIEFKNCAHAPAFMNNEQVISVKNWLDT